MNIQPEIRRFTRPILSAAILVALLFGLAGSAGVAQAQTGVCGPTYTVRPGDNLSRIAVLCNTTVAALVAANPQIVNPNLIFPGQVLTIPAAPPAPPAAPDPRFPVPVTGPGEQLYAVRPGDTLSHIAVRFGTTLADIIQRNPQIANPNLIFPGQQVAVPTTPVVGVPDPRFPVPITGPGEGLYTVRPGDNLSRIALLHGTTLADIIQRNPQIVNPRLIFPGQQVVVPDPAVDPPPPPTPPPPVDPPTGVIHQDDFSVTSLWFVTTEPDFNMRYEAGGYRIFNNFLNSYVNSVRSFNFADIHVAVDASRVAGPETGLYGVVCRWQDVHNFYGLGVASNGTYGIVRVSNGIVTVLSQGTVDAAHFNPGAAVNRVGGTCSGATLALFVNDAQVAQVTDAAFASGFVGLFSLTRTAPGLDVHFDNFAVLNP